MKKIVLKLYEFDELSKDSQERIIEREHWNVMEQCMDAYGIDYKKSMKAFEDMTDTRVYNWEVGYERYDFSYEFKYKDHYLATIQTILDRCDDNNTSPSIDDMEIIKINLCRIIQTRYGITQLWFIPLIERIQNACCKHYNDVDMLWENFVKKMIE